MNNEEEDDNCRIYKLLLLGDSSVGKSCLLLRYCDEKFQDLHLATIGLDFRLKKIFLENDKKVKVQIWDTAGQERYRSITNAYYKGAKGCLLVYDITNKSSFESLDRWLDELKNNGDDDVSIMLVGNKNDLDSDRAISLEEGKKFAEFRKMAFIETSALNGDNIEKAFSELISDVYKSQNFSSNKKDNIKLNEKTINIEHVEQKDEEKEEPLAKKGCCS